MVKSALGVQGRGQTQGYLFKDLSIDPGLSTILPEIINIDGTHLGISNVEESKVCGFHSANLSRARQMTALMTVSLSVPGVQGECELSSIVKNR